MKTRYILFVSFILAAVLVLAACGGASAPSATEAPASRPDLPVVEQPPVVESFGAAAPEDKSVNQSAEALPAPMPTMAAYEIGSPSGDLTIIQNTNRKIIKNAEVRLLVKDTDVAIDRSTQIVGDLGGYIVSSRVWYQDWYGQNMKYASITIGVPVDAFEHALSRLRGLAIRVLDETASGEDVTEQYVDLQSQLQNLEATRERIKSFLEQAKTVEEALRINQELANIENQIEQIKGRMNYLSDRSAFSTITINFEPELPEITPTPTLTPTATPTPIPWKPGDTFNDAKNTVTLAYQGIANFLIWLFVVVVPILLPPVLILWVLWKLLTRKPSKPTG